jgi:hypothetical protein
MRVRLVAPAMLALIVAGGGLAIAGARATPNVRASSCTAAQKSQRQAALSAYRKRMVNQRSTYFANHKSVTLRRAFVHQQQLVLNKLVTAAACTVSISNTARLARLRAYAGEMNALNPLFDPAVTEQAEDDLAQITSDEETCDMDSESPDCPVPASEYQATAKSLRDAAGRFKNLATKLAAIVAPTMSVSEYNHAAVSAAADCGVDLTTIATAHKRILNTTNNWVSALGGWADTYAAGKSVDWDTLDYVPGGGSFGDDSRDALVLWAVMVNAYWNSLAESHDVASAPPVPEWISSFNDDECPPPD